MTSTIPVQVPYRPEFFSGFNFTSAQVVFITAKIVLIFIVVVVVVVVAVIKLLFLLSGQPLSLTALICSFRLYHFR